MLNDIARVFSSNGVLLQGSQAVPAPVRQGAAGPGVPAPGSSAPDRDQDGSQSRGSGPGFDQASSKLDLSPQGQERLAAGTRASGGKPSADGKPGADGKPLSPEQEKQVRELEKRDREVKAHEAAHQAAAGGQARGGAAYEYQTGPDGKSYAIGGHVDIEVSPVQGNPQATLRKALTAQRAALAPADPSGQDRAVAAAAAQMAAQAQAEIAKGEGSEGEPGSAGASRMRAYGRRAATGASVSVYA